MSRAKLPAYDADNLAWAKRILANPRLHEHPFSGAGTTGLACLKNGRNYIGIELNPAYIEIAHQRARKYYPLLIEATA